MRSFPLRALMALILLAVPAFIAFGGNAPATNPALEREAAEELSEITSPNTAMMVRMLSGGSGLLPTDAFPAARRQGERLAATTAQEAPGVAAAEWQLTGPTGIGGRILDIAIDPDAADTIYAAAASGGVWKSSDAGQTFESVWPADEPQAIGSVAMTADGVLFAGTGESGPGGGSLTYGGDGVYRSTDRGVTWENVGLTGSHRISRVVADPHDPKRIWVAASGNLFKDGGERGLYRSDDLGESWQLVLAGANGTTGATDIAIDPSDPDKALAAMWDHKRGPNEHRYFGRGSGLFRTTDGGKTWTRTGGLLSAENPALGRIGVAYSADGKVAYAIAAATSGRNLGGLYRSADGGATWDPPARDANMVMAGSSFSWWFGRVWVTPDNANDVFVAGVALYRSTNGGQSSTGDSGPHADQHAMAWDPKVPGRVYLGNDGGVYRSEDNGARGTWEFGRYQPWSQLYSLDVSEQRPDERQVAGLQDNGSNRSWGGAGEGDWDNYVGGDGLRTLINPKNDEIIYGCSQYGGCAVSRNGGNSGQSFWASVVSARKNWFTPIEFDPADPDVLYTGGELMSKSTNGGTSWTVISPDLSGGPQPDSGPDADYRSYGSLTTISPSANGTVIWAGTDDGNLWVNKQSGALTGWTKISSPVLPKGTWVTRVQVDPRSPLDTAYVTYSGFRSSDDKGYLFKTTDGGATWVDKSGDLPRAPLNDVNVIGGLLVVASDLGVFASADDGVTWRKVGSNLPLAPVHELRYHEGTNHLFVATFGRSIWKVALPPASEF